jgi:two-component system sensor histidine kinase/response regulator
MNRFLLLLTIILLALVSAPAEKVDEDSFMVLDMRNGFPESRIRDIRNLPGGNMVIATTSTISIFDRCNIVKTEDVSIKNSLGLPDYRGFRKLSFSNDSIIWLKNYKTLHAFTFPGLKPITDFKKLLSRHGITYTPANIFPFGDCIASFSDEGKLYISENGKNRLVSDMKYMTGNASGPLHILADPTRLYLFYQSGELVVLRRDGTDNPVYKGTTPSSGIIKRFKRGVNCAISNDTVCFSRSSLDETMGEIYFFSVAKLSWIGTTPVPFRISDISSDRKGNFIAVGKGGLAEISWSDGKPLTSVKNISLEAGQNEDLSSIEMDDNGVMAIGTTESGLLYSDPSRGKNFSTQNGRRYIPETSRSIFRSPLLETLAKKYADGTTNCSQSDSTEYSYLGTRNGLIIIKPDNDSLFTASRNFGLASNNIQSLILHDDSTLWGASSCSVFRIRHDRNGNFEIRNYGIIDGIDLRGKEFRPRSIRKDPDGTIIIGFPGGAVSFHPDSIACHDYGLHRRHHALQSGETDGADTTSTALLAVGIMILTIAAVTIFPTSKKHRDANNPAPEKETAQSDGFIERLTRNIKNNIGNEELSVASLSTMMAMERTVLYRKTQSSIGMSPSAYIKKLRIEEGARLLRETNLLVADIAVKTGFTTPRYFTQSFKEAIGMTPSEYRAKNLSGEG